MPRAFRPLIHRQSNLIVCTRLSVLSRAMSIDSESPQANGVDGEPKAQSASAAKKAAKLAKLEAAKAAKAAAKQGSVTVSLPPTAERKVKEKKRPEVSDYVNTTPFGEKKDVGADMGTTGYNPKAVESAWYAWWEKQGYFRPRLADDGRPFNGKAFVLPAPPPNVTGSLHLGHALTVALQDALIRWRRMRGETVLYVPGFDHASISTQSVVEKLLLRDEGKTRHDLGREVFMQRLHKFANSKHDTIANQLRRLGASFDWEKEAYTMDDTRYKAVMEAFVRLYEDGSIYRANRLVNFCPYLRTTLSNVEVDTKEFEKRTLIDLPGYGTEKVEVGCITSFKYLIEGSDNDFIVVATTRPETMLGDTAIAVNPNDERYKHLHGKYVRHPFLDRRIPIITDDYADMSFGTGAVKITPAHDPNDYKIGLAHNLEFINILNDDGTLNENAGPFKGVKRFTARRQVIEQLTEKGLFVEKQDNKMSLPFCAKSGDVVEPIMKPQWYLSCKTAAQRAIDKTRSGELVLAPDSAYGIWYGWLNGIEDWCISRQLWWGQRIPMYFVRLASHASDRSDADAWVAGRTRDEAEANATKRFPNESFQLEQDEDVLDTWFSSGLWPFSTLGWPEQTTDMRNFFPNTLLETGGDIIFFWVARMVMMSLMLTDQLPFTQVFLHPMVRDAHGRKMSKTLGNVIDPIDVMEGCTLDRLHEQLLSGNLDAKEIAKAKQGQKRDFPKGIPECGTDAMRFTLCNYTAAGRDVNLSVERIEAYRRFCNKLWNATRFAMLSLGDAYEPEKTDEMTGNETLVERWILDKLDRAIESVNRSLETYHFMNATASCYDWWLYDLCDVYIEAMKPLVDETATDDQRRSARATLYTCLDYGLRILHPFMPYITEELWQRLPRRPSDATETIVLAAYPTPVRRKMQNLIFEELIASQSVSRRDDSVARNFDRLFAAIKALRGMAASVKLTHDWKAFLQAEDSGERKLLGSQIETMKALLKPKGDMLLEIVSDAPAADEGCLSEVVGLGLVAHLAVKGRIDVPAEINRVKAELVIVENSKRSIETLAAKPDYEDKVPLDVRDSNSEKLKALAGEIATLQASIRNFELLSQA